jgi:hypothetical protein
VLAKILIGIAGVLVLFVAVVATRRSAYHVERQLEVAAPADLVFGVLNDLHQFAGLLVLFGSPLDKRDPNMRKTFEGPAAGVGQSFAWSGNKEVGKTLVRAATSFFDQLAQSGGAQGGLDARIEVEGNGQRRVSLAIPSEQQIDALAQGLLGLLAGLAGPRLSAARPLSPAADAN